MFKYSYLLIFVLMFFLQACSGNYDKNISKLDESDLVNAQSSKYQVNLNQVIPIVKQNDGRLCRYNSIKNIL